MVNKYILKTAIDGLWTNKARSGLTILGIVIGIASIVLIVSMGRGAEQLILSQMEGMGGDTIVLRPGKKPTGLADIGDTLFSDSLKARDIEALEKKSNVPELVSIAPSVMLSGTISYFRESYRPLMFGSTGDILSDMFNVYPEHGRLFDENDVKQKARVAVIGYTVKVELFGQEDAIGKKVRLNDQSFRVVGVFPKKGTVAILNVDEIFLIPYTTAMTYVTGTDYYNEVIVKVTSPEVVDRSVRDIEATIRDLHNLRPSDEDDFYTETQQGVMEQIGTILSILTLFLASVVAISLVVGGIGVMNIMLVSVTERTKEIGLRKALGATNNDILTQFLIEAVILTVAGGIIGIAFGVMLAMLASWGLSFALADSWSFSFPVFASLLSVGVSASVGLLFGIYPARKASRKSPIEALRYE